MKLVQLRYFLAACEYRNFTKAAEAMNVSQPSVSAAIQELEREFGVTLLKRSRKEIRLTPEGSYLKERAKALVGQADILSQEMCDLGDNRKKINLGVPPMIGTFLFPGLYAAFKERYPEIRIFSREGGSKELLQLLDAGELDLAVLPSDRLSPSEYQMIPMVRTETVFCVPDGHPLAESGRVDIREITGEPLIMFQEGFYQNEFVKQRYGEAGCTPNIIHYSSQFYTIQEFIRRGIACGFMFKDIADRAEGIVGLGLTSPMEVQISLVHSRSQRLYGDAMRLMEFVKRRDWRQDGGEA